jgi:uncharacterized protein (TIGR02145 family)
MLKSTVLIVLIFACMVAFGQNITITFTGTGAATQVESVTAMNLTTNQSATFPGNEALVLSINTGVSAISELTNPGVVFPNPFSGKATLYTMVQKPQSVLLKVQNLVGRVVAQTQAFVQSGVNGFELSVNSAGIYMVTISTEQGTTGYKVICTGATTQENNIKHLGSGYINNNNLLQSGLKSSNTGYSLGFTLGNVIHYTCKSGVYTSILTDSPSFSKNFDVEFVVCTDPDGKNYGSLKIGDQTWMSENLAYLPAVSPSSAGSDSQKHYYVYGYEGSDVSKAKQQSDFSTYGVLYNWPAAMNGASGSLAVPSGVQGVCPWGWHLPSDEEWKILEKNQGMSESDANSTGLRYSGSVGGKIKEAGISHWHSPNTLATNSSGFSALPGGARDDDRYFEDIADEANFWSASYGNASIAWSRGLTCDRDGVYREKWEKGYGFSVRFLKN